MSGLTNFLGGVGASTTSADKQAPPALEDDRFRELYRTHYRRVVGLCRRYLGNHRDIEAVAQEAFIRAWESRERYHEDRQFWPWVSTIARRLCINEVRSSSRREALQALVERYAMPLAPSGAEEFDRAVQSHDLARLLRTLPFRQRRLLELRDLEGWSYAEIAHLENTTVEAVRGSLRRARATFRRRFEELAGDILGGAWLFRHLAHRASTRLRRLARAPEWTFTPRVTSAEILTAAILVMSLAQAPTNRPEARVHAPGALPPPITNVARVEEMAPAANARPASEAAVGPDAPGATTTSSPVVARAGLQSAADELVGSEYSITPSPGYATDRTVFASRSDPKCDSQASSCRTLFKSTDGGSTWAELRARGFKSGTIMLPPAYPRDNRIFAGSISMSTDGGESFEPLAVVPGLPTMSPLFSEGDERILFAGATNLANTAVEYDVGANRVQPLSLPLPADVTPMRFAFSPTYAADKHVLVSGIRRVPSAENPRLGLQDAALYRCDSSACSPVLALSANVPVELLWRASSRLVLAWTGTHVFVSTDSGRSFEEVMLPASTYGIVHSVTAAGDRLFMSLLEAGFDDSRLYRSDDGGRTWHLLFERGALLGNLVALPDGALLGAPIRTHGEGIRCSVDGGRTWAKACPRRGNPRPVATGEGP